MQSNHGHNTKQIGFILLVPYWIATDFYISMHPRVSFMFVLCGIHGPLGKNIIRVIPILVLDLAELDELD